MLDLTSRAVALMSAPATITSLSNLPMLPKSPRLKKLSKRKSNSATRLSGLTQDRAAKRLLKAKGLRKRLMAIITLGHLREQSAWDDLAELAQSPHPVVSLSAARALVDIDP